MRSFKESILDGYRNPEGRPVARLVGLVIGSMGLTAANTVAVVLVLRLFGVV